MPPTPSVRPATTADLAVLGDIWVEMMRVHAASDGYFSLAHDALARWRESTAGLMNRNDAFVLMARLHHQTAGFCLGWVAANPPIYERRHVGFLSEVAVRSALRRQGVGGALMGSARQWFAERGLPEFQLSCAAWNSSAQAFWQACGGESFLVRYRFPTLPQRA